MNNTFCQHLISAYKHQKPGRMGTYESQYLMWGIFSDYVAQKLNLSKGMKINIKGQDYWKLSRSKMKKAIKMGVKFVHKEEN